MPSDVKVNQGVAQTKQHAQSTLPGSESYKNNTTSVALSSGCLRSNQMFAAEGANASRMQLLVNICLQKTLHLHNRVPTT